MAIGWRDIAFQPGPTLAAGITQQWLWLTGRDDLTPFLCSMFGDVFATDAVDRVHWLNCSVGEFQAVAPDRTCFDAACQRYGNEVDAWFAPGLVERLHAAGKQPQPGEAYMFLTLPIFAECRYEPENFRVMPVNDIFIALSDLQQLYRDIPDGTTVRHTIDD